jgi:hypothetical protein
MALKPESVKSLVKSGTIIAIGVMAITHTYEHHKIDHDNKKTHLKKDASVWSPDSPINKKRITLNGIASSLTISNAAIFEYQTHHASNHITFDEANSSTLPSILIKIGGCESSGSKTAPINYRAQNPTSSASGGFQIEYETWNHYDGYEEAKDASPKIQDQKAIQLLHTLGTSPWDASESCWR